MKKLSLMILFLCLSACSKISSNEVEASSIYGELSLSRTEGSTNATASASFFVGGSTGTMVVLDEPAKITINGQAGNEVYEQIIGSVRYERSIPVTGNAAFSYTDKEGTVFNNTLNMPGSLSMSVSANTVFKSTGFVISYSTTSGFGSGEQLEVYLSTDNAATWDYYPLVTNATSGSTTIPSSELTNFNPGSLTIRICRESHPVTQAPYPKGTNTTIKSCADSKTVNLQP